MGSFGLTIGASPTIAGQAFAGSQIAFGRQGASLDLGATLSAQVDEYVDGGDATKNGVVIAFSTMPAKFAHVDGTHVYGEQKRRSPVGMMCLDLGGASLNNVRMPLTDIMDSELRATAELANEVKISRVPGWTFHAYVVLERSVERTSTGIDIKFSASQQNDNSMPPIVVTFRSITGRFMTDARKMSNALDNILYYYRLTMPTGPSNYLVTEAGIAKMDTFNRSPDSRHLNDPIIFEPYQDIGRFAFAGLSF